MVHNLREVAWDKFDADNYAFDWALEASDKMKKYIPVSYTHLDVYKRQAPNWPLLAWRIQFTISPAVAPGNIFHVHFIWYLCPGTSWEWTTNEGCFIRIMVDLLGYR